MWIVMAFRIQEPMFFEIRTGGEIAYKACGDAGDWCLVLSNGWRVFVKP